MQSQQLNYNVTPMDPEQKLFGLTYKPTPSDRELEWDKSKVLLSKTDSKGIILYANESFIDVCGYDDFELISKSHNISRHPDMPKVIFKLMWENLERGNNYHAVIKNMSKTGRYYWVVNDIKSLKDDFGAFSYTGKQKSVSNDIIAKHIEPLYKKLLQIEKASGVAASENYLIGFLEERGRTYLEYIENIVNTGNDVAKVVKKKGFFTSFFADAPADKVSKK